MSEKTLKEWRGYFTPLTLTPAEEILETLVEKTCRSACIDIQTIIDLAEETITDLQAQLAKLQWVKITPKTMPEVNGNVLFSSEDGSVWPNIAPKTQKAKYYLLLPPLPDKEKSDE